MNKKYIVRLTDAERRDCNKVVSELKGSSQKARRAQILLKADADGPAWKDDNMGLSGILCHALSAEVCMIDQESFGIRPSKRIAKWFKASFHFGIGIVHFFEAS